MSLNGRFVVKKEELQCFSKNANQSPRSLPAQDFSIIADMLRHELLRVWYEDAHEILKASDKKPEDLPAPGMGVPT